MPLHFMNFLLFHGTSADNTRLPPGGGGPYNGATWNKNNPLGGQYNWTTCGDHITEPPESKTIHCNLTREPS